MKRKNKNPIGRPKGIIEPGTHLSTNVPLELANWVRKRSAETGIKIGFILELALKAYRKAVDPQPEQPPAA